ncbi:MAG: aminoacyl-tRNA hydrolase [Campylobacterales bacterium]|nr:aminoacyl-tRNA hydrolase [Campylobacterales bacterium]
MSTLIVGLGNPGPKYHNNRHNIGFLIVDELIEKLNPQKVSNKKFQGELYKSKDLLLLKPDTFMNLSGVSVQAVCNFYEVEKVICIHDDLELKLGTLRFKKGGGSGGHNGLKSMDEKIEKDYYRIRVGIGKPEHKSQVSSYVLSDFSKEEFEILKDIIGRSVSACEDFIIKELPYIQQTYTKNQ